MAIVAVGADLAATDSEHEITIVDLRAGLTERGLYVDEKGNQALGDVLGVTGLNLPSTMRKYIDFLEPGQPPPRGWRRARGFVHQSGLLAYAQSRRCYRWPPPPGIDRAFLAERFLVPEGWDWSAFGL